MPGYNGWKNYQTWNCWLWLSNDECLYRLAKDFAVRQKANGTTKNLYPRFIRGMDMQDGFTGDKIRWLEPGISIRELNDSMLELAD